MPDPVVDLTKRHRYVAGRKEPDTIVDDIRPCFFRSGRWQPVSITSKHDGKIVVGPGEKLHNLTRVVPGHEHPAKSLKSPTVDLVIPPTRLGGAPLWPKAS